LRQEVADVKYLMRSTVEDYDRKLAELSYAYSRRMSDMNAEYDNLAALVNRAIDTQQSTPSPAIATSLNQATVATSLHFRTYRKYCLTLEELHLQELIQLLLCLRDHFRLYQIIQYNQSMRIYCILLAKQQ
jgi:hypothetical protein